MLKAYDWRQNFVQKSAVEERRISNVRSQIVGIDNVDKNDSDLIIDVLLVEGLKYNL